MKNTIIKSSLPLMFLSLAMSLSLSLRAQDAGTATTSASANNTATKAPADKDPNSKAAKSADQLAEEWVAKKGWLLGDNPDGATVAIGSASFSGKSKNTALAKSNAHQIAMLMAKEQIAENLAPEISNAVAAQFGKGNPPPENNGVPKDVVEMLAVKVKESGKSPDDVLASTEFANAVKVAARAVVCGATVSNAFQTVDGRGEGAFSVVVRLTPTSFQLANAALGKGEAPHNDSLADARSWVTQASEQDLAGTFGVRLFKTGNGEVCVLAFGQDDVNGKSQMSFEMAKKVSRTAALGELRQFVGELVEGDELLNRQSSIKEMGDNQVQSADSESFNQLIQARAQGLKLPGVQAIRQWQAQPDNGNPVSGTVVIWSVSGADKANVLRKQMEAIGGDQGGEGRMNSTPSSSSSAPAAADRNLKRITPGAAGPETPEP